MVTALLLVPVIVTAAPSTKAPRAADGRLIGVNLEGVGDGARSEMFVDLAKTLRPWTNPAGGAVSTDSSGWPTADAMTVLFDIRPFGAWWHDADDPAKFQPDWSGVYHASLHGQASLSAGGDGNAQIEQQHYDISDDTTTFVIDVPRGEGLLTLTLTGTKRTAAGPVGSGFTDLRVVRPGYRLNTQQIFTTAFLRALAPFSTLRMMDVLDTNHNPGYYGDPGHHAMHWADRRLPSDTTQAPMDGKYGMAWEYVADLANATGKDIWINVPIAAGDGYVRHLARFLKRTLRPGIRITVENSNEVWNYGFPQYIYNKLAAIDEVKSGGSPLNNDGEADQEVWARRRYAERLVEISNIFRSVYGDRAMMTTIRPVYASWTIAQKDYFAEPLDWVARTYGAPDKFFYAMALGHYFNAGQTAKTGTTAEILAAMRQNSDDSAKQYYKPFIALAESYGLRPFVYEGGSDTGGGDQANVAGRIAAERSPQMKSLIVHDVRDNWWSIGGRLYMYFSLSGAYSRFGCWGLTEDIHNTNTPKFQAIRELARN